MSHWNRSIIDRLPLAAALLLTAAVLGPLLLAGCESKPEDPVFDNPFDPYGPELGNALNVVATVDGDSIVVVWQQRQEFDIAYYDVAVSESYGSGYQALETVPHTTAPGGLYRYGPPDATKAYYFRVTALRLDGTTANTSYMPPAMLVMPPFLTLAGGDGETPTRYVPLEVTVSQGDTILIADNDDFTDAVALPVAEPGIAITHVWDVGPAEENGARFHFRIKSVGGSYESVVRADSVEVDFAPALTVGDGTRTTATRLVTLHIPDEGVVGMRFAFSAEDLAAAEWLPGAAEVTDFELIDTLNSQRIYAEFESDFGFTSDAISVTVAGDPLTSAEFGIALPREITNDPVLNLACDAVATHVRFGELPGFETAPWRDYADTLDFQLSAGTGTKTVYAQFRNDFVDSELLTAEIEYIEQPLAVDFLAPLDGATLTQTQQYQIRGWADAASPAVVDSVRVDVGDGEGFVPVVGVENWLLPWTVPELAADADSMLITMRARAWSAADSVTAQVTVKVR